jgi:hypothetical protein
MSKIIKVPFFMLFLNGLRACTEGQGQNLEKTHLHACQNQEK